MRKDGSEFSTVADILDHVQHVPDGAIPELRIMRQASIEGHREAPHWHQLLDQIGHLGFGKGITMALGAVHVSYVTATEITQMTKLSYPKIINNRSKTRDKYRQVSRHFTQFVQRKGQDAIDSVFGDISLTSAEEVDAATEELVDPRMWGVGSFALTGYRKDIGKRDLGFGFGYLDEDLLLKEMSDTREFLRQEGFDTSPIDDNREPHITVFKTLPHLVSSGNVVAPKYPPARIQLDQPRALVSQ